MDEEAGAAAAFTGNNTAKLPSFLSRRLIALFWLVLSLLEPISHASPIIQPITKICNLFGVLVFRRQSLSDTPGIMQPAAGRRRLLHRVSDCVCCSHCRPYTIYQQHTRNIKTRGRRKLEEHRLEGTSLEGHLTHRRLDTFPAPDQNKNVGNFFPIKI